MRMSPSCSAWRRRIACRQDQLQHGEEGADQGAHRIWLFVEQAAEADGAVFHEQAALDVVDHLRDGDGFFVDVVDGAFAQAGEDVLEDADQVDGCRRRFRRSASADSRPSSRRNCLRPGVRTRWPLRSAAFAAASGRRL